MYADRKQWAVQSIHVDVVLSRAADKSESIERVLKFAGTLTDEQRSRLADIAERTPVTLTLKSGLTIHTTLG
jgi:putative redox protein